MTWNLSAMESNPRAKDLRSQKGVFLFLSVFLGDLWQAGSHLCAGPDSPSVLWHIILSQEIHKPDHLSLLIANLWGKKCRNGKKPFSHSLDNSTEPVRILKFRFKEVIQGKIFICISTCQNGHCVGEALCKCIPTHIHIHVVSRLLVQLLIKSSSLLKAPHL